MDAEGEHSSGRCRVELALFLNELSLCASLTSSCPTSTVRSLLDCRSSEVTEVAGLAAELGKRRKCELESLEGRRESKLTSSSLPLLLLLRRLRKRKSSCVTRDVPLCYRATSTMLFRLLTLR